VTKARGEERALLGRIERLKVRLDEVGKWDFARIWGLRGKVVICKERREVID